MAATCPIHIGVLPGKDLYNLFSLEEHVCLNTCYTFYWKHWTIFTEINTAGLDYQKIFQLQARTWRVNNRWWDLISSWGLELFAPQISTPSNVVNPMTNSLLRLPHYYHITLSFLALRRMTRVFWQNSYNDLLVRIATHDEQPPIRWKPGFSTFIGCTFGGPPNTLNLSL